MSVTSVRPEGFGAGGEPDAAVLSRAPPDAFVVVREGGVTTARAALFWSRVPDVDQKRAGYVGHFWARDAASCRRLLDEAVAALRGQGVGLALGPVDGSTWERYRFVVSTDPEPPFFLEPANPPDWPEWWTASGFSVFTRYVSMERTRLDEVDPRYERFARRRFAHLRIVGIAPPEFEDALRRVYPLVAEAFAKNILYTPLPEEAFLAQYGAARALVDRRFCLLAEVDGRVTGFAFAYPDPIAALRGDPGRTVILKTLAARTSLAHAFTGTVLSREIEVAARDAGYQRVIYALMQEDGNSAKLGAIYGRVMRTYALYARPT